MRGARQAKLQRDPSQFRTAFAGLGTVIEVIGEGACDPRLASWLAERTARAEQRWSKFLPDSEISRLNATHDWVQVSAPTAKLLDAARSWAIATNQAFTPLIGPLAKLWNVRAWLSQLAAGSEIVLPSPSQIEKARAACDIALLETRGEREFRVLAPGELDVGGIAKGMIADELADLALAAGLVRALVCVGRSSITAVGTGAPWRVGIRALDGSGTEILGRIKLANASLSTSGDYLQQLPQLVDGQLVHHVIDPHTGYPSTSPVRQASVVARCGITAEVASTVALVRGRVSQSVFPDVHSLLVTKSSVRASANLAWQSVQASS